MEDLRIKSASEILSTFFDREIMSKAEGYASFSKAWRTIVGSRLGDHSRPIDIRHGVLIVETDHQGWTQLLLLKQDKILKEIEEKFAALEIRGIGFTLTKEVKNSELDSQAGMSVNKSLGNEKKPDAVPIADRTHESELPQSIKAIFKRIKNSDGQVL